MDYVKERKIEGTKVIIEYSEERYWDKEYVKSYYEMIKAAMEE